MRFQCFLFIFGLQPILILLLLLLVHRQHHLQSTLAPVVPSKGPRSRRVLIEVKLLYRTPKRLINTRYPTRLLPHRHSRYTLPPLNFIPRRLVILPMRGVQFVALSWVRFGIAVNDLPVNEGTWRAAGRKRSRAADNGHGTRLGGKVDIGYGVWSG